MKSVTTLVCFSVCISHSIAFTVTRDANSVSISPFPVNVGRNKFFNYDPIGLNKYVDTYFHDPDTGRSAQQLIESRGFRVERHWITTEDGYILAAYRMVNPFNKNKKSYPILMFDSFFIDVSSWLWNTGGHAIPPRDPASVHNGSVLNSNLAYSLSNHGYDVWLVNTRGVDASVNHTTLSLLSPEFWKFSFDERGLFDLPASIDYIKNQTLSKTIGYVGYSAGSWAFWQLASTNLRYNDYLKPVILMACATPSHDENHPNLVFEASAELFRAIPGPFFQQMKLTSDILTVAVAPPLQDVWLFVLFGFLGYDYSHLNRTRIPVYLSNVPSGVSTWTVSHFFQSFNRNCLSKFDYGREENERRYGSSKAPCYDLSTITNRYVSFFVGKNDQLLKYESALRDAKRLTVPVYEFYTVPDEKWAHLDFAIAKASGRIVNPEVLMVIHRALSAKN